MKKLIINILALTAIIIILLMYNVPQPVSIAANKSTAIKHK